ncbi:MAG: HYR domain-containing protein [Bacteroidetes bacterium]|nr:HYR domain-containing protein [Bacteroidota bacterium]
MKQNKFSRLGMLWTFLIVLLAQINAHAGLITCGDNINLSPGANCMVNADVDFVITTSDCTGPYWLVAKELNGDTIVWGVGSISFDATAYLGTTITIEVKDIPSGTSCESNYDVYDGSNPIINCPTDTISCTASLDPADLKPVTYSDNCGIDTLFFQDDTTLFDCNFIPATFISSVNRTWTVRDVYGNEASCIQYIYLLRPDTSMVQMPADITIDCSASTDPDSIGRPTIDGRPVYNNGLCNLFVSYTDTEIPSDCGTRPILRRWVVSDNCIIADVKIDTQLILLQDIEPPVFTGCGDSVFYQTDIGLCSADIVLDMPNVTDNCSEFAVQASIPGFPVTTDFTFQDVPKGMRLVTFVATDSCGNISAPCTRKIFVIDNETPTAICKNFPIVSLPSNGTVDVLASVFNAGSHDNCPGPLVFTGSRDGLPFTPAVNFNCADAGDTIMVTMKVAEGGNLSSFNTCMVQVVVQDKIPPGISCPGPQTIQCTADYSDLSVFGSPFVYDPCGYTLTEVDSIDIQNCGVGTIIREFTATDSSGNSSNCTQVISVINSTPYNGQGIVWPLDTMLVNYCAGPANLGPSNLPAPYNFPITPTTSCAMLAVNYVDQVFNISSPACYKIVRTWKVIDWCQYNPANPTVGAWTHQQIVAVVDTQAPVITYCPSDTTVSVDLDCSIALATFFPVTATDCSPNITITNNQPYATSNGADASGYYPQGIHHIVFTVKDGCGNKSKCEFNLTVKDLKDPTPYCNTGIVSELQLMAGQAMASVQAVQFNDNSFDNCTAPSDLTYTIRLVGDPNAPTSGLVFDCDDEGAHQVEVWVTDEEGNSDFCVTTVFVQDNMDVCPFNDDTLVVNSTSIQGYVESMMGDEMPQVEVAATNAGMMAQTNNVGIYQLNGLQTGGNYAIAPQKDISPLNGVTSFDLLLITSHVLGTTPFTDPYKLIAADANHSGKVTTIDIIEIRKLILHIYDNFPNNTSWRFVPKSYVFPNPTDPSTPPFPEALYLTAGQQMPNADFVGIKIGDVNGSALPGFTGAVTGERTSAVLPFVTADRNVVAGEEITVPIKITTASDLLAIQFTLEFIDDLELRGYEKGALPSLSDDDFGRTLQEQGVLTAVWFNPTPAALKKDDALFNLRFLAKKSGRLSEMLSMTARYTDALAYQTDGQPMLPVLEFSNLQDEQTSGGFQLYQNQPNPFKENTTIGFTLPERAEAKLTIYDADGRILKIFQGSFEKGYNEVNVERSELQSGGVVFYKLETPSHNAVRKMILLQ